MNAKPCPSGGITRFFRVVTQVTDMRYYVVDTKTYLPEPVAEYLVDCFSLKLPKRYYEVGDTIIFVDEEQKTRIDVPASQLEDVAKALLASTLDFFIALGVCMNSNLSLYNMIKRAREKVKKLLKIDDINLDPEFPICLKGGGK
ncbi:MAG: hypothetical protein JHC23_00945 [Sulfolobus sp.]|nr:hypothetical protein [Sulfolobus sp.]